MILEIHFISKFINIYLYLYQYNAACMDASMNTYTYITKDTVCHSKCCASMHLVRAFNNVGKPQSALDASTIYRN